MVLLIVVEFSKYIVECGLEKSGVDEFDEHRAVNHLIELEAIKDIRLRGYIKGEHNIIHGEIYYMGGCLYVVFTTNHFNFLETKWRPFWSVIKSWRGIREYLGQNLLFSMHVYFEF